MEPNRKLFNVLKSESENISTIIDNVLAMLSNRIYIDNSGNKHKLIEYGKAKSSIEDQGDNVYTIKVDNGNTFAFKIIFQKITTSGKSSEINDFFKDYANYKKIVIAQDYNNKIVKYINQNRAQIFKINSFASDIIKHRDQPEFELLTNREAVAVKQEYNVTDYTIGKMLKTDPVAKYFALKKGDIIRIIRPSPTSGKSVSYRIVM